MDQSERTINVPCRILRTTRAAERSSTPAINPHSAARIPPSLGPVDVAWFMLVIGSVFARYVDLDTGLSARLFNTCIDQQWTFEQRRYTGTTSIDYTGERGNSDIWRDESGDEGVENKTKENEKEKKRGRKRWLRDVHVDVRDAPLTGWLWKGVGNHHHHRRSHQQGPDESSDRWSPRWRNNERIQGRLLRRRAPTGPD